MSWEPKGKMWNWRACLTKEEAKIIAASDRALKVIQKLRLEHAEKYQRDRMIIVNRAIQRAKYDCAPRPSHEGGK